MGRDVRGITKRVQTTNEKNEIYVERNQVGELIEI